MFAFKLFAVLLFISVVYSGVPGGFHAKDSNDSECQEIANKAIAEKNAKENGNRAIKSIDKCQTQVVAGMNFRIDANVCDKENSTFKRCSKCSMKVFRGLQHEIEVTEFECKPVSR